MNCKFVTWNEGTKYCLLYTSSNGAVSASSGTNTYNLLPPCDTTVNIVDPGTLVLTGSYILNTGSGVYTLPVFTTDDGSCGISSYTAVASAGITIMNTALSGR